MKFIGAHVSTSGGVFNAPGNAASIGAKAFALFTKNQRQWSSPPLLDTDIKQFHAACKLHGYLPEHIIPHDSYLINIGNPEKDARTKSINAMVDELTRCSALGLDRLNMHPGSHLSKMDDEACCNLVADGINAALEKTKGVTVVVETTAGQGGNIGWRFEHVAQIINRIEDSSRIGVCIDTCHIFAAGYDIRTPETYKKTMDEFETIVGFKWLRGVHLNDAKVECGSRVDRHQNIGKGNLGIAPFTMIMNDSRFDSVPMVLETIDESLWSKEISTLYGLIKSGT